MFFTAGCLLQGGCLLQPDVYYSMVFATVGCFVTEGCLLRGEGGGVAVAGCMLRRNVGYSFLQHDICYSGEFVTAGFYSEVFVTETYEDAHWQTKM